MIHHTFPGHTPHGAGEKVIHTFDDLSIAISALRTANLQLKRCFPPKSAFILHLLQRNYFQVINSSVIVAVAPLATQKVVDGGTGWAVSMAIDMRKPIHVFDVGQTDRWYTFDYSQMRFVSSDDSPLIQGTFAGIGSRNLTDAGAKAIEELLKRNRKKVPLCFSTAQYRYKGPDRFDITIKSSKNIAFAPTWSMVMDLKTGKISEVEYEQMYLTLMRQSYKNYRHAWEDLLRRKTATLVCFCQPGAFCHRVLLAKILSILGARYLGETT